MAQEERTGQRNLSYSLWHRKKSISRFVDSAEAEKMYYQDIDGVECCHINDKRYPIFFIETAYYNSTPDFGKKPGVCLGTAELSNRPCFVVLYKLSKTKVLDFRPRYGEAVKIPDIEELFVKRFFPDGDEWKKFTPEAWAKKLLNLRKAHETTLRMRLLR